MGKTNRCRGNDRNGIHIACTSILNKADTVLRPAAGVFSLDKPRCTEPLYDEIRCLSMPRLDFKFEKE